jgi:hypothetical protein
MLCYFQITNMKLKMQPTLYFQKKLATEIKIPGFFRKCIVGYIFNSVELIITRGPSPVC